MRVLVVGSGPAGLSAAKELAKAGADVTVVERQSQAGGVPRLCGHSPYGMREFHRVMGGASYADRLTHEAQASGARVLLRHSVTAIDAAVHLSTPDGPLTLTPDRILLATGAREASRAERLLPGERPLGVITTGALQDLWFARGVLPFRHPVILGTELVAMSAILTCRQAGARPVAVVDNSPQPLARAPFRWLPRVLGIPVHPGVTVEDILATDGHISALVIRRGDALQRIACDGLVMTGQFRPESGLARMAGLLIDPCTQGPVTDQYGRTSRADIFAAGNLLRGIETAGQCWAEGQAIARAMLADPPPATLDLRAGGGLRYVTPQRLAPGAAVLNLRLDRVARGTLTLTDATGRRLAGVQTASAPERRVTFDLAGVNLAEATGPLTVAMEV